MKQFKNSVFISFLIGITLAFVFALSTHAQSVQRNGKVFVEQCDTTHKSTKKEPKKTEYTYVDKKGVSYPIYISSGGKAFIIRTSKKTGKQYRQYLPEVTKQLSK